MAMCAPCHLKYGKEQWMGNAMRSMYHFHDICHHLGYVQISYLLQGGCYYVQCSAGVSHHLSKRLNLGYSSVHRVRNHRHGRTTCPSCCVADVRRLLHGISHLVAHIRFHLVSNICAYLLSDILPNHSPYRTTICGTNRSTSLSTSLPTHVSTNAPRSTKNVPIVFHHPCCKNLGRVSQYSLGKLTRSLYSS